MTKESPYRSLSVLIADDSRSIRDLLAAILQAQGVERIHQAADGESAIKILETSELPIDLMFCDLLMPGTDGVETMRRIGASRISPAIALISGYDPKLLNTVSDMAVELGLRVVGTLGKPFNEQDIKAILKDMLLTHRVHRPRNGLSITIDELDEAIRHERVEVLYQPKVRLSDGTLKGVEALVRLQHPSLGLLDPDLFIPLAEKSGRITTLTMLMLRKAIEQAGQWRREGLELSVAINMSIAAMRRLDLPEIITDIASKAGVPNECIVLEITESQVESGPELLHIISRFRLRGFHLSIDDYGTGQSGLQRLKRLPFTELKLDKAFVSGAWHDNDMRSILETSIELGHRLRMEVIAEGIETWQDWKLLKSMGCDLAQGYLVSKPLAGASLKPWAEKWSVREP